MDKENSFFPKNGANIVCVLDKSSSIGQIGTVSQYGVFMNDQLKNQMKKRLIDLKAEVLNSLIAENNDFRIAVEESGVMDLADMASNDIDAMTLEAVGAKDKLRLQRIDSALARLENGRFGSCAACGLKIAQERLEAIPYSVLCINCQSSSERRGKHQPVAG